MHWFVFNIIVSWHRVLLPKHLQNFEGIVNFKRQWRAFLSYHVFLYIATGPMGVIHYDNRLFIVLQDNSTNIRVYKDTITPESIFADACITKHLLPVKCSTYVFVRLQFVLESPAQIYLCCHGNQIADRSLVSEPTPAIAERMFQSGGIEI